MPREEVSLESLVKRGLLKDPDYGGIAVVSCGVVDGHRAYRLCWRGEDDKSLTREEVRAVLQAARDSAVFDAVLRKG